MKLREICELAWREVLVRRTQSVAVVVVMGAVVGLVLAILMITQGLENVVLKYAQEETGGVVYLANYYKNDEMLEVISRRIDKYGGEIVMLMPEQAGDKVDVAREKVVVKFDSVRDAYEFYKKKDKDELHYRADDYEIVELFGNQMAVYGYFRRMEGNLIVSIVLVLTVVAAVIAMLMMSYTLVRNMKTFALYRTLGASRKQVLLIGLVYLGELWGMAMILAVLMAVVLAGVATLVGWQYLSGKLGEVYPGMSGFRPILIGWSWKSWAVIVVMMLLVPVTLILSLDQFSTKKMAWRLKGE